MFGLRALGPRYPERRLSRLPATLLRLTTTSSISSLHSEGHLHDETVYERTDYLPIILIEYVLYVFICPRLMCVIKWVPFTHVGLPGRHNVSPFLVWLTSTFTLLWNTWERIILKTFHNIVSGHLPNTLNHCRYYCRQIRTYGHMES